MGVPPLPALSCYGPRSVRALMRAETWTKPPPGANTVVNPMPTLPFWLKTAVPTTLDRGPASH